MDQCSSAVHGATTLSHADDDYRNLTISVIRGRNRIRQIAVIFKQHLAFYTITITSQQLIVIMGQNRKKIISKTLNLSHVALVNSERTVCCQSYIRNIISYTQVTGQEQHSDFRHQKVCDAACGSAMQSNAMQCNAMT